MVQAIFDDENPITRIFARAVLVKHRRRMTSEDLAESLKETFEESEMA
jgi:hypothetical protein